MGASGFDGDEANEWPLRVKSCHAGERVRVVMNPAMPGYGLLDLDS
jgi:hypothetical protein